MKPDWNVRKAKEADVEELEELIHCSARGSLVEHYTPEQISAALGPVFGVDRQLIYDGTFYVVEADGQLIGCGGWSKRDSLFGGDAERSGMDPLLDPAKDAARIRAFFVDPGWTRQGIGRAIMDSCENAIREEGFQRVTVVATLSGEQLYASFGYAVEERFSIPLKPDLGIAAVRMRKTFS